MKNTILKRSEKISEINATLYELTHIKTGAEIIYLECDDDENVFNISFRTFPDSSNGVAHVLEHIVLCGSEKYPVKDPFFAMGRRSMNTFMNALTGADFTCYPAASQIEADFYNLMKVYLDAVFHPRLLENSFYQEGLHFGFSEEENIESPLQIKGIVYNEMKGALNNPESRLHEELSAALFPDLPYRFNSGGNPKVIRNLTLKDLKEFHKKYYHPSRALFYFYGNLSLEKHLTFLEEYAFKGVEKIAQVPLLPRQKRFSQKKVCTGYYPIKDDGSQEDKAIVALAFLTTSILEQEELLALQVLELALMGTDAAPLKAPLIESNLCKIVDESLDDELSEVPFVIICKGCHENSAPALEKLIRDTLNTLAKEGISPHLIEGAIHQLEFARTEITGSSFPYGLNLFFRSGLLKQHGGDPADGLRVHTLFKKLRDKFEDPTYIPYLLHKYFLDNLHSVRLTMLPDPDLTKKELEEEGHYIKSIEKKLSHAERKEIVNKEKQLLLYQEDEGDLEVLPRLSLNDVPRIGKDYPLEKQEHKSFTLYAHDCFTNDIFYSALYFDLPKMAEEDMAYVRLFSLLISELGAGGKNYKDVLDFLFQYTGGVGCDLELFVSAEDPSRMKPMISLKGKSLKRNIDKLISLYIDLVHSTDFSDVGRLEDLLKQHLEGLENSIQRSPLRYATNLALSSFSPPLRLQYLWHGLDYYWKVKEIVKDFKKAPELFIQKMNSLKLNFGINQGDFVLSIQEDMLKELKKKEFYALSQWQGKKGTSTHTMPLNIPPVPSQARIIASAVAYTVLAFPTLPFTHPMTAVLSIAAELMENRILHKRIREQGGAYGSGASHMPSWGYFYFYSYRDPHIASTLDAFQEAVKDLIDGNFNDRELEEAKLGVFQSLDVPNPPESRGIIAYTWLQTGRTKELRQQFRDRLFATTKEDIKNAAKDILQEGLGKGTLVSFAGKELLTRENGLLKQKLPLFEV